MASIMRRRRGLKSAISILLSEGVGSNTHILSARRRSTPPRHARRDSGFVQSALEKRLDALVKFLERGLALDLLAIDEKGRRRIDLQHLAGVLLVGGDLVEQCLILQAILDLLLA